MSEATAATTVTEDLPPFARPADDVLAGLQSSADQGLTSADTFDDMSARADGNRIAMLLSLAAAAAVGACAQQLIKHDARLLGMSRLELHVVLGVVGAVTSRGISREIARRAAHEAADA